MVLKAPRTSLWDLKADFLIFQQPTIGPQGPKLAAQQSITGPHFPYLLWESPYKDLKAHNQSILSLPIDSEKLLSVQKHPGGLSFREN